MPPRSVDFTTFTTWDDSCAAPHDIPWDDDRLDIACPGIRPATWIVLFLIGLTFFAAGVATGLQLLRGFA